MSCLIYQNPKRHIHLMLAFENVNADADPLPYVYALVMQYETFLLEHRK
jgi:hypothetical protein